MPGNHSNDIIKGNIDRRRSWHTFRVSITVLFKTPLPCPAPRFYPWKLEWKHYHVQPTSPQLSAPTSRRSLATIDRSAPRSTAPSPADFFPSPTHPHMQTRVRFGIQRKSNHQTRHTENEMPIYAIYRIGGPSHFRGKYAAELSNVSIICFGYVRMSSENTFSLRQKVFQIRKMLSLNNVCT